ncbi:MAG: exodeoxyribonuclease V subunit gamma, partial [Herbaspirillum sp.]
MMLHIRFSNRYEILCDALLERVLADAPGPFDAIDILIPGSAMQRQLELALADRFGICANVRFSFLAQWLWTQIGKLVEVNTESPFDVRPLSWRIDQLLSEPELQAAHPRLASYLANAYPVMRLELAQRCAALFDQYTTYRPEWGEKWLRGDAVMLPGASDTQQQDQ